MAHLESWNGYELTRQPGPTAGAVKKSARALKLDLLMAFVGAWDIWEVPYILEENGYLEGSEAEELCTGPLMEAERKLRWYVLRAYLDFCNRSHLSN